MHVSWRYCYDRFLFIIFGDKMRFLLPEIRSKICVTMVVHSTVDEIATFLMLSLLDSNHSTFLLIIAPYVTLLITMHQRQLLRG